MIENYFALSWKWSINPEWYKIYFLCIICINFLPAIECVLEVFILDVFGALVLLPLVKKVIHSKLTQLLQYEELGVIS